MIDLHTHTNHSDGTDSVEELLKNAEKSNIEILSITDHDSVGAYFELEKKPIEDVDLDKMNIFDDSIEN